jgi:hypothetical protein
MRAEGPSWKDTCRQVSAQLDELIATLSVPPRAVSRRQELGRSLAVKYLRTAQQTLAATVDPTPSSNGAPVDEVAEWLEQGEYLDPDELDWPER